MPVHDWTLVQAGIFHDFHNAWIAHLRDALNGGLLPPGFYALGEQRAGEVAPDVLTLSAEADDEVELQDALPDDGSLGGAVALAEAPPKTTLTSEAQLDTEFYVRRRKTLVIRRVTGDQVVALIEIASPGNTHNRELLNQFLDKSIAVLMQGLHLLLVDLFPPRRLAPCGLHGAIWSWICSEPYQPPTDLPLTLASYRAADSVRAWIEPVGVGSPLPDMPLFLTSERYVAVPLEETYQRAYRGVPARFRRQLER